MIDETYLVAGPPSYNISVFKANAGIKKEDEASFSFLSTPNVWSIYGRHTGAPDFSTGEQLVHARPSDKREEYGSP